MPFPLQSMLLWLGVLLMIPSGLVLLMALAMAEHSPSQALTNMVGPAVAAGVLGWGMMWLSSWSCPDCQRIWCAEEVSKHSLGNQTTTSREYRDGKWVTVTKTQRKIQVTMACQKCGHTWTTERSRTLRERAGWGG